ncbi:hypothetical protein FHT77_000452 [Rhizobium sp. BK181]|uniref:hypothetical protein n=1 Tax=Rhizobium sp. BK181 TaxID=2587072 RepID=UPI00161570D0|nr:hypothetical protein [Rhizobium sp. BK181]MBB3314610.1 hypothetical protein [Rhizobium sp. BK181]
MCVEAVEFAVIDLLKASAAVGADAIEEVLDIFRSSLNAGWQMTNSGVAKIGNDQTSIVSGQTLGGFQHADAEGSNFGLPAIEEAVGRQLKSLPVTVTTTDGEEMFWATDWLTAEDDESIEVLPLAHVIVIDASFCRHRRRWRHWRASGTWSPHRSALRASQRKEDMLQLKTETIAIRSPRVCKDWASALRNVGDVASSTDSYYDVRAAVADARTAFVTEARKYKRPIDEYEFGSSIANVLFNTGFHRDRNGHVRRLADLISVHFPHFGNDQGRPCLRFSIRVVLENGSLFTSRETLEWLHLDGLVAEGSYVDRHPEAFVETARALDTYMTDVEKVVRAKLDRIVKLSRPIKYAIVVRQDDSAAVPSSLVTCVDGVPMAFPNAAATESIKRELVQLGTGREEQPRYEIKHVNRLSKALRDEIVKWHGNVLVNPEAA